MYSSLRFMLRNRVTRHIVSLRSSTCHNLKSAVVSTVLQLLPGATTRFTDEDDDSAETEAGTKRTVNKASCSLMDIVEWYNATYAVMAATASASSCCSPTKRTLTTRHGIKPEQSPPVAKRRMKSINDSPGRKDSMSSSSPTSVQSPGHQSTHRITPRKSPFIDRSRCGESPSKHRELRSTPLKNRQSAADMPSSRHRVLDNSPQKCPMSPGPSRSGLRSSGMTPKKCCDLSFASPAKKDFEIVSPSACLASASKKAAAEAKESAKIGLAVRKNLSQDMGEAPSTKVVSWEDPSTRLEGHRQRPPVVILFEDFEGFDSRVLQDFITICGYHLSELPVVLIFGIATNIAAVHHLLPHRVTSLLTMEKFQAPLSSEYLSLVLSQILLNHDFPFKLGPRVFDFLLDVFLYHDFSVLGFIRGYEFAMMEHFFINPASVLCQSTPLHERMLQLSDKQLEAIRQCASFKRYVEEKSPAEQSQLLKDNIYTKKEVAKMLSALDSYHTFFYPVLSCLHAMTSKLPGSPLGKQLRELYATCLADNVFDTEEYRHAITLLRSMSRDELVQLLSRCVDILSKVAVPQTAELGTILTTIQVFCDKFHGITDLNFVEDNEDEDLGADILPKKTTMYALRQKLQELDKHRKDRKLTIYEKLRNEAVDFLELTFRQNLASPKSFPLHEAVYYDTVSELKRRLCAAPRSAIQTALSHPHHYIKNEALNTGDDAISADLPDICIVYKLHLECGRLINLYDWLQAFASIVQSEDQKREDGNKLSTVIQARFIRAVSELHFLGFVKPTKRKTDHVARLTWGPC